jgi:hypothetical protein
VPSTENSEEPMEELRLRVQDLDFQMRTFQPQ